MDDMNMFMGLLPPTSMGAGYDNMVVNIKGTPLGEEPSGEVIAKMLGFSDKDTIGSALNEVIEMANKLNVAITISGNSSIDQTINAYLNNADPTQPGLPPIKSMLITLQRDLQAGKLGDVQINVKKETETKNAVFSYTETVDQHPYSLNNQVLLDDEKVRKEISDDAKANIDIGRQINANANFSTPTISFGKGEGGNPWLAGNAYVTFLVSFMEMQRTLMQSKVVQGNIELTAMDMTYQLAKETAHMIKKIAEMNQMIHITQAVMAGVSLGISVVSLGAGITGVAKGWTGALEFSQASGALGGSIDKFVSSIVQAMQDIPIAEKKEPKKSYKLLGNLLHDKWKNQLKPLGLKKIKLYNYCKHWIKYEMVYNKPLQLLYVNNTCSL